MDWRNVQKVRKQKGEILPKYQWRKEKVKGNKCVKEKKRKDRRRRKKKDSRRLMQVRR